MKLSRPSELSVDKLPQFVIKLCLSRDNCCCEAPSRIICSAGSTMYASGYICDIDILIYIVIKISRYSNSWCFFPNEAFVWIF